jgi:glutamate carboxypeptidase
MAEEFGFSVEKLPQPLSGDPVVITMNPNAKGKPITFSGHIDTVYPVGSYSNYPTFIEGDKIYGPGVTDCKGGIVSAFMAIEALIKAGYNKRPLMLLLQTDEEYSMSDKGCIAHIANVAKSSVAFFNLESSIAYGTATIERKGIVTYTFTVEGVEAHASKCAIEGASAILEASHKIIELEKLKDNDGITCNCGVIKGGSVSNTVPGVCEFNVDFRYSTKEELEKIKELCELVAKKVYVKGCVTSAKATGFRIAMVKSDKNYNLLDKVNEILQKNDMQKLKPIKTGGASDAADITDFGIPCLDGFGVIGGRLHSPSEFAEIESLKNSAKKLAVIANEL